MNRNRELIGTSLFANDRWELSNVSPHRDKIERATHNAWHALIDFGETYEYPSIMRCAYHLITLFIEDYPSEYTAYDIGITAVKIAFTTLSQGKVEDFIVDEFGSFFSKKLLDIELKMLAYPYNRCFSLMETELLSPDDVYSMTVNLIEEQIGDRMERRYLAKLRKNIFDYYDDLQSRPFFEQEFEPYVRIGGSPSFANRFSNPAKSQITSMTRRQPERLPPQNYPKYLDRNDIPSI
jgi:hypothetical protein